MSANTADNGFNTIAKVTIVCHDAGGANQILAMVSSGNIGVETAYMEGPALSLWTRLMSNRTLAASLDQALGQAKTLMTGTGWSSTLEYRARKLAKRRGIFSISVLDHWTNYSARFERDGEVVLPDELWVVDEYALERARSTFPELPIVLKQDCYAEQQLLEILPLSLVNSNELLYLLEPARSDWGRGEVGELQALRYFLERLPDLNLPSDTRICLRPHPSDPPGKYAEFLSIQNPFSLFLDKGDLAQALSRARWVAGCQTYALTLALKAGRRVYGTLPPWAPACRLPHRGLIHLREMSN
jgi:hypothetical protein